MTRTLHGWPLFVAICLLAVTPLLYPPLGTPAVCLLFAGWLWITLRVRRKTGVRGRVRA